MIFVAGTLTIAPAQIDSFETAYRQMRARVLAEDGCSHYSLLTEDRAEGVVNALEIWRDDAALAVHLQQPWIAEFFARFSPHMRATTVQIYDIAGAARPLPGM